MYTFQQTLNSNCFKKATRQAIQHGKTTRQAIQPPKGTTEGKQGTKCISITVRTLDTVYWRLIGTSFCHSCSFVTSLRNAVPNQIPFHLTEHHLIPLQYTQSEECTGQDKPYA